MIYNCFKSYDAHWLNSTFFIFRGHQEYGKRIKQLAFSTLFPPTHTYIFLHQEKEKLIAATVLI